MSLVHTWKYLINIRLNESYSKLLIVNTDLILFLSRHTETRVALLGLILKFDLAYAIR